MRRYDDNTDYHQSEHLCLVCNGSLVRPFIKVDRRNYQKCLTCQTIFLNPGQRPSPEEEYARYREHNNSLDDPGYRSFLSNVSEPLLARLPPASQGLDYGCGPEPVLAHMLAEAGHRVRVFDIFFYPDPAPLDDVYDFITCTETIEHLHYPARVFQLFDRMLLPGASLALMTSFVTDEEKFASWYYRRDPTHVVFYQEETLLHIAGRFGWRCVFPRRNVALMKKPHHIS